MPLHKKSLLNMTLTFGNISIMFEKMEELGCGSGQAHLIYSIESIKLTTGSPKPVMSLVAFIIRYGKEKVSHWTPKAELFF